MVFRSIFIFIVSVSAALAGPVDEARLDYLAGKYEEALAVIVPAAEAGDANAQNVLGAAYEDGNGVPADIAKAVEWYGKSAAQGYSKALLNLGLIYRQGRPGIAPDYARAAEFLEQAAAQDNPGAMNELGLMAEQGYGRPADPARAAELYEKAHDRGSVAGTANLAALYARGLGVEQDYARAFALMQQAASRGNLISLNNLGVMYEHGYHVAADPVAAYLFYSEAMRRGYAGAAYNLSELMMRPDGYWYDPVNGLAHCYWAERNDRTQANAFDCQAAAAEMSESDLARARTRADDL